jgi:aspartokinase
VGVASERDVLVLEAAAVPDNVLGVLDEWKVAGKQLYVRGSSDVTVLIPRENLHDEDRVRAALTERFGGAAKLIDGRAVVSAIGAGITAGYGHVRAGSRALSEAGITVSGVATSSFRITWTVPRDRADEAARILHRQLIESARPLLP